MLYKHTGGTIPPMTIAAFFSYVMAGHTTGPVPLVPGATTKNIGVNDAAVVPIGAVHNLTRAMGLITCASVIYRSTNPAANAVAYVQHINAGAITVEDVGTAIASLGNPPLNSIYVIYAHPNPTDGGYTEAIGVLAGQGIPAANIIEIENLGFQFYGINNLGQIG